MDKSIPWRDNRIVKEVLGNSFYIKALFLFMMIVQSCIYVSDILGPFVKLLLVYGFAVILYDFITVRNILRNRYKWFLIVFCFFLGLSVVVNYQNGIVSNTKLFLYTLLEFFVIAMVPLGKTTDEVKKEYKLLAIGAIGLLFVISLISLYTFVMQIQMPLPGSERSFIGISPDHRLFGISGNPNKLGIQMIVLMFLSCSCFVLSSSKKRWWLILPMLTGMTCLMLSGSRGAQVAFIVGFFFFVFFCALFFRKSDLSFVGVLRSVFVSVLICFVFLFSSVFVQYAVGFVPDLFVSSVQLSESSSDDLSQETSESKTVNRVETSRTYSDTEKKGSGRLVLWTAAMKIFENHPFFGVGNASVYEYGTAYMGGLQMIGFSQGNVHNLYLQILVSSGLFALLSFLVFIAFFFIKGIKFLLRSINEKNSTAVFFICLFCGILMILIHQMFERQIIYLQSILSALFAIYLGYYQFLLQKDEDSL